MSAIIDAKKQEVDIIAEQLKNSVSTVIVDYRGLSVAEVTELRSQLREAGVEYKVLKNTMVRRAAQQAGIDGLDEFLVGPTAVATSTEDVVAPAKVIAGFAKEHQALEIKTGVMEGNVISAEEVNTVGTLPSHDGLVSMLLSVLQAPVRNFAYAVKAIEEEFGVTAAAPVAAAGAAAGGDAEAEKTDFDVELTSAGSSKIKVVKAVKEATGLGLKDAKELVDGAPKVIKEALPKEEAEKLKEALEEVGATVELK